MVGYREITISRTEWTTCSLIYEGERPLTGAWYDAVHLDIFVVSMRMSGSDQTQWPSLF